MKIIQNLLLIFIFLFFTTKYLFAGLGTSTLGPGGIKQDIEVNEIEEIENEEKKNNDFNNNNKFKSMELKTIDSNTVGILTEDEGGLGYDMWVGSEKDIVKNYLKNLPINKESNLAIDLIKILLLSNAAAPEFEGGTDLILIRINKLIELGDFDNAKSLIDLIINDNYNEEISVKQT
jgi:hypothetical protein